MRLRNLLRFGWVVVLLLALLAPPATATTQSRDSFDATSRTIAGIGSRAALKTVELLVTGCEGCTITAYRKKAPRHHVVTLGEAVVVKGVARFQLRRGWSVKFAIEDPARPNPRYSTLVVMRYKGLKTGTTVTGQAATRARKASVYLKVPKKSLTLRIRVDDLGREWDSELSQWTYYCRAYAEQTQRRRLAWHHVLKAGIVGAQDL